MIGWEQETFEWLNNNLFRLSKPGPLHSPVESFTIVRDDKMSLRLDTCTPGNAEASAIDYPSGTLRINRDSAEFVNPGGIIAILSGLQPFSFRTQNDYASRRDQAFEKATIHRVDVTMPNKEPPTYTVNWLDNTPRSPFSWPDSIKLTTVCSQHKKIGGEDGLTIVDDTNKTSMNRSAVKITVAGVAVYLCAMDRNDAKGRRKPGCIIYAGTPDYAFQDKVRIAISFALGVYLVDLGSAIYDREWRLNGFQARSAYALGGKAFDLIELPPAPTGYNYQHEIDRIHLERMINQLVRYFDTFDLKNLSWAYWHARCATPRIAGVHYGAAIETLQRSYMDANPKTVETKIIPDRAKWSKLSAGLKTLIATLDLPEAAQAALCENMGALNKVNQREVADVILRQIDIQLGPAERGAWKRRNEAAHGSKMEKGGELALIGDTRLLMVLFHRMLLRLTNSSDFYHDYSALNLPIRKLSEAASP